MLYFNSSYSKKDEQNLVCKIAHRSKSYKMSFVQELSGDYIYPVGYLSYNSVTHYHIVGLHAYVYWYLLCGEISVCMLIDGEHIYHKIPQDLIPESVPFQSPNNISYDEKTGLFTILFENFGKCSILTCDKTMESFECVSSVDGVAHDMLNRFSKKFDISDNLSLCAVNDSSIVMAGIYSMHEDSDSEDAYDLHMLVVYSEYYDKPIIIDNIRHVFMAFMIDNQILLLYDYTMILIKDSGRLVYVDIEKYCEAWQILGAFMSGRDIKLYTKNNIITIYG